MTTTDTTPATVTRDTLASSSVQRFLYPLARVLGITGYAGMQKPALVDAILLRDPDELEAAVAAIGDPQPVRPAPAPGADALADAIRAIAATVVPAAPAGPDVEAVRAIVAEEVARLGETHCRRVIVSRPDLPDVDVGVQHERFPLLMKVCTARQPGRNGNPGKRLNPYLWGPPGTGKTTAARAVAEALSLPFGFTGALDGAYGLLGFIDAGGRTVRTQFRERVEFGGVFLFDELDASHPSAPVAFNAVLDNGICAFPDAVVPLHPDCILIASANTSGYGATAGMTGRVRQDAAAMDRFTSIPWGIDERLEASMSRNPAWLRAVRAARRTVGERKLDAMVTPRAVLKGDALLEVGADLPDVLECVLRCGLADAAWKDVHDAAMAAWVAP